MIKISNTKYVLVKRYDLYKTPAIPLNRIKEDKALFLCFMQVGDRREVWLRRDEIFS